MVPISRPFQKKTPQGILVVGPVWRPTDEDIQNCVRPSERPESLQVTDFRDYHVPSLVWGTALPLHPCDLEDRLGNHP